MDQSCCAHCVIYLCSIYVIMYDHYLRCSIYWRVNTQIQAVLQAFLHESWVSNCDCCSVASTYNTEWTELCMYRHPLSTTKLPLNVCTLHAAFFCFLESLESMLGRRCEFCLYLLIIVLKKFIWVSNHGTQLSTWFTGQQFTQLPLEAIHNPLEQVAHKCKKERVVAGGRCCSVAEQWHSKPKTLDYIIANFATCKSLLYDPMYICHILQRIGVLAVE